MATYLQGDTKISIIPGPFLKSDTFEFLSVRVYKGPRTQPNVDQAFVCSLSTDPQALKTNTVLICIEKYACPCYHTGLGLGHIRPHSLATNLTVICYNHPGSPIAWQCARVQQVTKIEMSRCKEQLVSMPSPTADMLISELCYFNFWVKLYIK